MVGAVFVKNGKIIAEGFHKKFGGLHAEVEAIRAAARHHHSLKGATLYITLEPCAHHGKQGPCTEALLNGTGLSRVVYAQVDPNPQVAGKGLAVLKQHGIRTQALMIPETEELNEVYLTNVGQKRPFVHLKTACTLEGKITLYRGTHSRLSHPESLKHVHELRTQHDAILIGVQTLLIDNPRLTARSLRGKILATPLRIILDPRGRSPHTAALFTETGNNLLITTNDRLKNIWGASTEILWIREKNRQIDLEDLLKKLFDRGIRSILVEGGARVNTAFLNAGLVDRLSLCFTPYSSPDPDAPSWIDFTQISTINLNQTRLTLRGNDQWITGRMNTP